MGAALFNGLAEQIVSIFAEDIIYVTTPDDITISGKVRIDYVDVDGGETYKEVVFCHFSDDALLNLGVALAVDDILTVREESYKILDTSTTGRGIRQCRLGKVI